MTMPQCEPLQPGKFYHIYNHGVGNRNLFMDADNYSYFIDLYDKYISPIADTLAWVLMPNHFHFLVRINMSSPNLTGFENLSGLNTTNFDIKPPHQYFSNLFNAYTKAVNKRYDSRGSLFERPFKRKLIDSDEYLKQVILYIHDNPVHHGFCHNPVEYPWSSYLTCISIKPNNLNRDHVIGLFHNQANFKTMHHINGEIETIEQWLEL